MQWLLPGWAMTDDEKVNAVALHFRGLMNGLDQKVSRLVGAGQHNIILVIGAGNSSQFGSNVPRERSIRLLRDLFARWQVGLPDLLPGERSKMDTRAFEYLLQLYDEAMQTGEDVAACRGELVGYVSGLLSTINRSKAR